MSERYDIVISSFIRWHLRMYIMCMHNDRSHKNVAIADVKEVLLLLIQVIQD